MNPTSTPLLLSVIIPTHNRASYLDQALQSLLFQSLPRERFEVVVIDDGSTDHTASVCERFVAKLSLRYFRLRRAGIAAAKNLGIFTAIAPILFFFDDDDLGTPDLLREHLAGHEQHPGETIAILGNTTWAPGLAVSELMDYVMNGGPWLFAYAGLHDGQELDFAYFWGGRTSCKRSLLVQRGIFDQRFQGALEDIELGYRLAKFGLRVVFRHGALQHMNRAVTYDAFCGRCERQGRLQVALARMHSDPVLERHYGVKNAEQKWRQAQALLGPKVQRVAEIEHLLADSGAGPDRETLRRELHGLYDWTFRHFKIKGFVEALAAEPADGRRP
jgi:glycosyltransferase involved in cell wall biosynthesis